MVDGILEFLCELFFEIILEGFFGLTVENPKAKTWTKTVCFLLLAEGFAGVMVWLSVEAYLEGNVSGSIGVGIIAAAWAVGTLIGAVYGHKRNWKQDDL